MLNLWGLLVWPGANGGGSEPTPVSQTSQVRYEGLTRVVASAASAIEALHGTRASLLTACEAVGRVVTTRAIASESLIIPRTTQAVAFESGVYPATTAAVRFEALGRAFATLNTYSEAVAGVQSTSATRTESLVTAQSLRAIAFESTTAVRDTQAVRIEAVGRVVATLTHSHGIDPLIYRGLEIAYMVDGRLTRTSSSSVENTTRVEASVATQFFGTESPLENSASSAFEVLPSTEQDSQSRFEALAGVKSSQEISTPGVALAGEPVELPEAEFLSYETDAEIVS